jgi:hypothetical protein
MYDINKYGYSYEGMVDSFGVDVLLVEESNDYQGDSFYLLKDAEGRYGYLSFGWGSCSGCDAFQAAQCEGGNALEELRDELWEDVKWFDSLDSLRGYLDENSKLNWYGHDKFFKVFLEKLKKM